MEGTVKPRLKTAFKKSRLIAPLHTNGPIALTADGTRLVTCVAEQVVLTDIASGLEICRFKGDLTPITSLAVSPSSTHLVVFYTSLSLRIYEIPSALGSGAVSLEHPLTESPIIQPIRIIPKCHEAPAHVCRIDPSSTLLASGSADGVVKVWDIQRGYVTHMFKGHGGVVSALAFNYPRETATTASNSTPTSTLQLITGSADTRLRVFDLSASSSRTAGAKAQAVLEGHVSVPRGLDVSPDGRWLISGGRDAVVLVWDLAASVGAGSSAPAPKGKGKEKEKYLPKLVKTIPILERIEAVGLIAPDETVASTSSSNGASGKLRFYTGGEKGTIRIWDAWEGKVLASYNAQETQNVQEIEEQREIIDVLYTASTSTISSLHADQNILSFSLTTGSLVRQHIGFNDEIIDTRLLSPTSSSRDSLLAVATNSSLIRLYSTSNLDARLLSSHSDMVLCLDAPSSGSLLVSGSKDKSARVWAPTADGGSLDWHCIAIAEGHAESIGAISISKKGDPRFMFTGSQDRTVKMWDLSTLPARQDPSAEPNRLKSLSTTKAHDKDINSLDIAVNDKLLATGSQDKTVNIYEIDYTTSSSGTKGEIRLLGTCKGHKRGVWNVKFSRTERYLATGSGDKTIKMWNLDDYTCLKTFEGHTNSVLRVDFINQGMQLVSSASDGLVKLWNVRDEECVTSLDNHEDKIWALTIASDEQTIISGAADSVITFWTDCTEELTAAKENQRAEMVLKEQDFHNYVAIHDYRNAILLALSMDQPGRLLNLFKNLRAAGTDSLSDATSITGSASVDEVIKTLPRIELVRLLRHVRDWNASARTSGIAQTVLHAVLKLRTATDIFEAFEASTAPPPHTPGDDDDDEEVRPVIMQKDSFTLKDLVDGLLPYTERHLSRADKMVQDSYVVDYVLGEMDMGMLGDDLMEVDVSA